MKYAPTILAFLFATSAHSQSLQTPTIQDLRDKPAAGQTSEFEISYTDNQQTDRRQIKIYRADQTNSDVTRPLYFHTPLFALVKNPSPIDGCPEVFWTDCRSSTDRENVRIQLRVALRTEDTIATATQRIVQDDSAWLAEYGFSDEQISVLQWPIGKLVGIGIDRTTGEQVFLAQNQGVAFDVVDNIDIFFVVNSEKASDISKEFSENNITIEYRFTYDSVSVESANRSILVSTAIRDSIADLVETNNLEDAVAIFQNQQRELKSEMTALMRSSTTATSQQVAALLPDIGKDYVDGLFIESTVDIEDMASLSRSDPKLAQEIYSHVRAIFESYDESNTQTATQSETETETETETQTETQTETDTNNTKFSISYPKIASLGISKTDKDTFTITSEQKRELEQQQGIKFETRQETGNVRPTAIEISKFASSWQQRIANRVDRARLASQGTGDFSVASPLPVSFTQEAVTSAQIADTSVSPFVPIGSALCTFRSKLPEGYVWADGSIDNRFPASDFFPVHLHGKTVPKMNQTNLLVGGADASDLTGTISEGGSLVIPEIDIDAASIDINLNAQGSHPVTFTYFDMTTSGGGSGSCQARPLDVNSHMSFHNIAQMCFSGTRLQTSVETGNKVTGGSISGDRTVNEDVSVNLGLHQATPHVRCRWIVRMQ